MLQPEPERSNVTLIASRRSSRPGRSEHDWLVPHMISLIGYAERHGLADVERALTEAAERIAPALHAGAGTAEADRGQVWFLHAPNCPDDV